MPDHHAAAFFAALSQDLLADRDELPTLERICERALEVVPAADLCSVTLRRRRNRLETVAATGVLASACDDLQYQLDEGPCVQSAREDEPFLVVDTAQDQRWPLWGPRVAELGVRSIISVQLSANGMDGAHEPLGAVNLYAHAVSAFDRDDVDLAVIFAAHAANALASARLVGGLELAMQSRHLIGVAQGVLMQRYDLTLEQSFDALQRYSNNANVKLRDLASTVVEQRHLPSDYASVQAPSEDQHGDHDEHQQRGRQDQHEAADQEGAALGA